MALNHKITICRTYIGHFGRFSILEDSVFFKTRISSFRVILLLKLLGATKLSTACGSRLVTLINLVTLIALVTLILKQNLDYGKIFRWCNRGSLGWMIRKFYLGMASMKSMVSKTLQMSFHFFKTVMKVLPCFLSQKWSCNSTGS